MSIYMKHTQCVYILQVLNGHFQLKAVTNKTDAMMTYLLYYQGLYYRADVLYSTILCIIL